MQDAPSPDTEHDQAVAVPTTMRVDRVTRLAARFPSDHKIRPSDGKLFLSAAAHKKLGNDDTVRALATHGMDLATTWERFVHYRSSTLSNTWTPNLVSTGNANGMEHSKDVVCRFSFQVPKNAYGWIQTRWLVWNRALLSTMTSSSVDAVSEDYGVNRRDRMYGYLAPAENGVIQVEETRFNGILLRPDDAWAFAIKVASGSQGTVRFLSVTTGHSREMDKGGF